jgi:hypothetical protein
MDYPYNLGSYTRKVTTGSADAQCWFDRGLNWCFGYHHEEAIACFAKALETDPNCAMAHWGVAYAAGPNYNFPWELQDPAGKAAALARAYDSTRAALALVARVSAPECALIEALPARYPRRDPIDDQRPWNDAFADAMRLAHKAHPDDLDLRFSFAEAILNRTPWRMWDLRIGEPAAGAGTRRTRIRFPRSTRSNEPSRPFAPPRSLDGNVAASGSGAGNRRPSARADPRYGPPGAHAHPHRRAMRPLPGRDALESEGDHRRP